MSAETLAAFHIIYIKLTELQSLNDIMTLLLSQLFGKKQGHPFYDWHCTGIRFYLNSLQSAAVAEENVKHSHFMIFLCKDHMFNKQLDMY